MDDNILFIIIFACIMHNYISMMEYITAIFCKYRNRFESATSSLIELELDYVDTDSVKRYKDEDEDEYEYEFVNAYKNNDLHVIKCDKCSQVFDSRNKRGIHKKYYMCPYQHEIDKTVTTDVKCIDCESVFDNKYLLYMHIYSKKCKGRDTHVRHIRLDNMQQISDNSEKIVSSSQQISDNGRKPASSDQQISDNGRKPASSDQQIPTNLINYGSAYTYSDNNQVWEYFGNILIEPKIDNYKQIIFDKVNNKNILNDVQFAILTGENMNITNFNEIIHKIAEHLNSYCEIINNNEKQIESERKENKQYKNIIENYKIEIIALHKKISLLNDKLKNRITSDKTMLEDYDKKIKQYEASIKKYDTDAKQYDTDAKKYKNTIEELNNKINNTKQMNNYLTSIMA
jgi:hypothetical protein